VEQKETKKLFALKSINKEIFENKNLNPDKIYTFLEDKIMNYVHYSKLFIKL